MSESQTDPKTLAATIERAVELSEHCVRQIKICQQDRNAAMQRLQLQSNILNGLERSLKSLAQCAQAHQRMLPTGPEPDQLRTAELRDHTPDT